MKKQLLSIGILIAYSAFLVKVMIFKDVPMVRIGSLMLNFGGSQTGAANLVPFKTIMVYLFGNKGLIIGGINLVGNIVLLIPVGLLSPLAFQNRSWKRTLALAIAAGFSIEAMQVVLQIGIFDIDDVILNALGLMAGYWIFMVLSKNLRSVKARNMLIAAVISLVIALAAVFYGLAFYQNGRMPVSFEPRPVNIHADQPDQGKGGAHEGADPCGGTGGTGQIVMIGNHTITIKNGSGVKEFLKLTRQTVIKSAAGPAAESDLKVGMGVTIVTMESDKEGHKIANAVMICK